MNDPLLVLYCVVDDFCKDFIPEWNKFLIESKLKKRNRERGLSISEIITIYVSFQQSKYRDFKNYYIGYVSRFLKSEFPGLVSYDRFITLMKGIWIPLYFFMMTLLGKKTADYIIDSTPIAVCHIKREKRNKVFKGIANKAKSTMGWFFGFKLHLVINDVGEIIRFSLTRATVDDREPVEYLTKNLKGRMVGDKGYISQPLFTRLYKRGLKLITKVRKNMKNKFVEMKDRLFLNKRGLVETVNGQLKYVQQIEHTRHRSVWNFLANILAALIAYSLQPVKPSICRQKCSALESL